MQFTQDTCPKENSPRFFSRTIRTIALQVSSAYRCSAGWSRGPAGKNGVLAGPGADGERAVVMVLASIYIGVRTRLALAFFFFLLAWAKRLSQSFFLSFVLEVSTWPLKLHSILFLVVHQFFSGAFAEFFCGLCLRFWEISHVKSGVALTCPGDRSSIQSDSFVWTGFILLCLPSRLGRSLEQRSAGTRHQLTSCCTRCMICQSAWKSRQETCTP